ncbi:MAG: phosphoribosylamine--glycine ligase [Cyanobacteriota bacterium]|nr:phosphoribosylamine--glycine ligase [Cyanobacteriota bacterium]
MKIVVVGSGGREHTLAWALLRSPQVQEVICIPGNGGTATLPHCRNLDLAEQDFAGIAQAALEAGAELVVIGPEQPLALGITDYLQARGLKVFGPSQTGAQVEASKAWCKALMGEAGIPTATAQVFTDLDSALAYLETQPIPIVIKADGLAAGKGVTVAHSRQEAIQALVDSFAGKFGEAGEQVVIEEYMTGQEASVLAITDGQTIRPLLPAQDHKAIGEGDRGPNTGGMGAYAPTPIVTAELMAKIQTRVLEPAIAALRHRGIDYRGILYAGLMITPEGEPRVVEFNCRFGDPETQAILPLLQTPLEDIMLACIEGRLDHLPPLQWQPGSAACVVLAAQGYPGPYPQGMVITGLEAAAAQGALVFQAGTRYQGNQTIASGGRVLGVTGLGDSFPSALAAAYGAIDRIHFDQLYYRRDIGHRVLG